MMNAVNICIFFVFVFVCAATPNRWIIEKSDHDLIDRDDNFWYITVSRRTNRPSFPAYIRFYNEHTAKSEYEINCADSPQLIYYNDDNKHQVVFRTLDHVWSEGDSYFVTLDEGVLFSDGNESSTAYLNPKFWRFSVVHPLQGNTEQ